MQGSGLQRPAAAQVGADGGCARSAEFVGIDVIGEQLGLDLIVAAKGDVVDIGLVRSGDPAAGAIEFDTAGRIEQEGIKRHMPFPGKAADQLLEIGERHRKPQAVFLLRGAIEREGDGRRSTLRQEQIIAVRTEELAARRRQGGIEPAALPGGDLQLQGFRGIGQLFAEPAVEEKAEPGLVRNRTHLDLEEEAVESGIDRDMGAADVRASLRDARRIAVASRSGVIALGIDHVQTAAGGVNPRRQLDKMPAGGEGHCDFDLDGIPAGIQAPGYCRAVHFHLQRGFIEHKA
ncbi:MAG: hypothetical protein BWY77_01382 [bacterium ADurb.Bin431]|nr:MAG: hypothetical protein BWY77_01382 [bacterium ADurb.Bin431]